MIEQVTFKDYQIQYETILPLKVRKALTSMQIHVHHVVIVIDDSFRIPECILRTMQLGVAILSCFSSLHPFLKTPAQLCKDAKNFSNFVKGMKSVDGFLNFKFLWRSIVLNVSGMVLFVVSGLSLMDRFRLWEVSAIKTSLVSIPLFGILPWGGLLPFSIVGLMGIITLFAQDKKNRLEQEEEYIKNKKILSWSQSLDLSTVQQRKDKYQTQVSNLNQEIAAYQKLIKEGEQIQSDFNQRSNEGSLFACQKALDELTQTLVRKHQTIAHYEQKARHWSLLETNWTQTDPQTLTEFQQAKQIKWEAKFKRVNLEKKATLIAIASNVTILFRQTLSIIGVLFGYGIITLPFLVNIALDGTVAAAGLTTFFMKRSIEKMTIPSANL